MVKIRKARVGDEAAISKMIKEGIKRGTWKYTGTNTFSKKKEQILRKELSSKSNQRHFIALDNNEVVASSSYMFKKTSRLKHRVDMGWGVHPDHTGRGLGTKILKYALEDAKKKGFKRAEAETAIKNVASWKMALKLGFEIEGTKKKALLNDEGEYIDTYILGKIL